MVAVDDVVAVAGLVDIVRWQLASFDHRRIYARPAIPEPPIDGEEAGIEVARLAWRRGRAHDLTDRDLLHAAKRPALRPGRLEHCVELQQPAGTPGPGVADRPPTRPEPCPIQALPTP